MGQVLKLRQKKGPRMIFGKHVIEQFKRDWHDLNRYRKYIAMHEMTRAFMGNPYEVWEEILADEEMEEASGTA